jgi:hypothetical protein
MEKELTAVDSVLEVMKPKPDDDGLNTSLDDVILLLEREVERLKAALDYYRLVDDEAARRAVRDHVDAIEDRQDRLDDLRALQQAARDARADD